ncbi:site-specific integrase [Emticicia agri]|uniref:Tyr recombinase domain-containing protein n=1 Tax=Emticicia agri TaxID=2492393 RepID=A0A4Q5LWN9_9BACT|nr:site-specific integrase [Emticicia agri]RYU93913.1 hypothetical protein EWM59_19935 [Emticicia agri]
MNELKYENVTPFFLEKYEAWMLTYGKVAQKKGEKPSPASYTTISIYLRIVRTMFNNAIADELISIKIYPFGKKGYQIPSIRGKKRALPKSDVLRLMSYEAEPYSFEERSRDLWIFSYLCNGMNFSDICRLRWIDVDGDKISFIRKKTAKTKKAKLEKIDILLVEQSKAIIDKWGNSTRKGYLFPFLDETMDEEKKISVISQVIHITNDYLKKIAKKLGIDENITTYYARHSFATILLLSGAPMPFIGNSMGHGSVKSTENYFGSFPEELMKKYLSALI